MSATDWLVYIVIFIFAYLVFMSLLQDIAERLSYGWYKGRQEAWNDIDKKVKQDIERKSLN